MPSQNLQEIGLYRICRTGRVNMFKHRGNPFTLLDQRDGPVFQVVLISLLKARSGDKLAVSTLSFWSQLCQFNEKSLYLNCCLLLNGRHFSVVHV